MTHPILRRTAPLAVALGLLAQAGAANALDWSDNMLGLQYGTRYREPGNSQDIGKWVAQFQHVGGYRLGKHFLSVDFLRSNSNDPNKDGDAGASEVYAVYRHTFSLSAVSGKPMKSGLIRDVGITLGADLNTKNDAFNSQKAMWVVGPTISLDVPGFFDISVYYSREHNHNGITHRQVQFDPAWQLGTAWGIPVGTPVPSQIKGYMNVIAPKGKDGFGAETRTETLLDIRWVFDFGQRMGLKKDAFLAGVGYQYWNNKFGNDRRVVPGAKASTPTLVLETHF